VRAPAVGNEKPTFRLRLVVDRFNEASRRGDKTEVDRLKKELLKENPPHLSSMQSYVDDMATARALADHIRRERTMGKKAVMDAVAGMGPCEKCGMSGFKNGWSRGAHVRHCKGKMPSKVLDEVTGPPPGATPVGDEGMSPSERTADEQGTAMAIKAIRSKASKLRERAAVLDKLAEELARA